MNKTIVNKYNINMKYVEDIEFVKKQLADCEVQNIDKLLKRYFVVKNNVNDE